MSIFSAADYDRLHSLVFRPDYAGYRPSVKELPNGDGAIDREKRYAHVALKYEPGEELLGYLHRAHEFALLTAAALNVPEQLLPDIRYSALRVLEYPAGAISNSHYDFDLFTNMLYRNQTDTFISDWHSIPSAVVALDPRCHLGEIGELAGLGKATKHSIVASDNTQHSVVYFSIPNHAAVLPNGVTVGDWLTERLARSRTYE